MPPSGFTAFAIQGAVRFAEGCFRDLHVEVMNGKHKNFRSGVEFEIEQITRVLENTQDTKLETSPTLQKAIGASIGSLYFIRGCYEDLLKELDTASSEEEAEKTVLRATYAALEKIHINDKGALVEKS